MSEFWPEIFSNLSSGKDYLYYNFLIYYSSTYSLTPYFESSFNLKYSQEVKNRENSSPR